MNAGPSRAATTSFCQGMQRLATTCAIKSTSSVPQVLVVRSGREADPSPPVRELRGLEAPD